jgi:hypothetical protein
MKIFILSLILSLNVNIVLAASFVDSLAKEFGKKNGCYSISLNDKKNKSYNLSPKNKNSNKSKR